MPTAKCHYARCLYVECHYVECHYVECHNDVCHGASKIMFLKSFPQLNNLTHFLKIKKFLQPCSKIPFQLFSINMFPYNEKN
jgi:hypothetical protein